MNLLRSILLLLAIHFGSTALAIEEWPRQFIRNDVTNILYQPQLESWDYVTLKAVSAVAVQPKNAEQPTFGSITFTAKTRVDRAERQVVFEKIEITDANFPTAGNRASNYLANLRSHLPKEVKTLSLDRVEASLAILEARRKSAAQPIKNDPPIIVVSMTPALLITIEGTPIYRPVEKTGLERVFNTRALILRDSSGIHYLHLFDGYLQSSNLFGPWSIADKVPSAVKKAEKLAVEAKQVDLLAGHENSETKRSPSLKSSETPPPEIKIATSPTELIIVRGQPSWESIPGTKLYYVTNTVSHLFKDLAGNHSYLLISGRWFRATSLSGPWEFVSAKDLPEGFAAIPDESPKENVKASIPGTRQAEQSLIANEIPSMVKVDRKKAKMEPKPTYNSDPILRPIEETSLQYAANSTIPVIKVNDALWLACQNGVWFSSESPHGPWMPAVKVPPEIYSIPPSSPLHYVVYARVYNYDEENILVGVTPGYYGAMVSEDGTIVYGTGYTYEPYYGSTIYVSYPITYGYGSNPCWTPWAGWALGFSAGWAADDDWNWWYWCPVAPYWGAYWGWCYGAYYNAYGGISAWGPYSWAGTSGYIYHQNGPWNGVSRGAVGYNAWTGNQWASSYGRAYNSSTGTRVVGQRGAVQNVYTGNYAYGARGGFYNENSGVAGVGSKVSVGNPAGGVSGSAGRATVYNPNTGKATHVAAATGQRGSAVSVNGNVVVGRDGNYYRPNGSGGWTQVNRPANNPRPTPAAQPAPQQPSTQQINNKQQQARQAGATRQNSYSNHRPVFRGGGGRRR